MKIIAFPDGVAVPALGQGTWQMGEDPATASQEVAALQAGIDLGMTLIDTAEMYGEGAAERLVGTAIKDRRDGLFLVSKVYPQNASATRLPLACAASLKRLGTDRLDLYLLHWRGNVPLAETVAAMERLVASGQILRWGVSNLDMDDMAELRDAGGGACATDQILYNLTRRGPEHDLLPWLAQRGIPVMAYSPVEQGRLIAHPTLVRIAAERDATPAQIALAWLLAQDNIMTIPKAGNIAHVRENRAAVDLILSPEEKARLDRVFPRPRAPVALEML